MQQTIEQRPSQPVRERLPTTVRVFVSSTWEDLQPERRAVENALALMPEARFVGMEYFGSRSDGAHDGSLAELSRCDLYIGIIGSRYGSGITEAEYRYAAEHGIDCHVYLKDVGTDGNAAPQGADTAGRLEAFRDDVRTCRICTTFPNPDALATRVVADLHRWLTERRIPTPQPEVIALNPAGPSTVQEDRSELDTLAQRVEHSWIHEVLLPSVAEEAASLPLKAASRPDLVEHPWEGVIVRAGRHSEPVGQGTDLALLFERQNGSLLILGEPGGGKTTTLLLLARELLARRARRPQLPVPVVFNLSLRRAASQPLRSWLVEELDRRYGIPTELGKRWVDKGRLTVLLDGLDEVGLESRAETVQAINRFLQDTKVPGIAVCCRTNDYLALPRLRLVGALIIAPLERSQIDAWLERDGSAAAGLRAAIRHDDTLFELAQSPLMLTLMRAVYVEGGAPLPDEPGTEAAVARAHLLSAFTDRAFERRGRRNPLYSREQMMRWLPWLAARMRNSSTVMVSVPELQPEVLPTLRQRVAYLLLSRLAIAGCLGILVGLPFEDYFLSNLYFSAGVGIAAVTLDARSLCGATKSSINQSAVAQIVIRSVLFVVISTVLSLPIFWTKLFGMPGSGTLGDLIYTASVSLVWWVIMVMLPATSPSLQDVLIPPVRRWRWRTAWLGAVIGFVSVFISTASSCAGAAAEVDKNVGWFGLYYAVVGSIAGMFFGGWRPAIDSENRSCATPVLRALFEGLILGAILGGLIFGALVAVDIGINNEYLPAALREFKFFTETHVSVISAAVTALWFGVAAALKHGVLRLVLAVNRLLPWRLERMLGHAVHLGLMRRVGGGYLFLHRYLLDYFSALAEQRSHGR